jgi:hypothetical protein
MGKDPIPLLFAGEAKGKGRRRSVSQCNNESETKRDEGLLSW